MPTPKSPPDFADPNSAEGLEMLCAANHPAEPVEWLWPGRIAVGKVTLLAGDPGCGKSIVALDIAARVTRGSALPDSIFPHAFAPAATTESPHPETISDEPRTTKDGSFDFRPSSPGSVLILTATDTLADTIRPRLDAAGADPTRVFILPSITDLRHDLGQLKAAIDRAPDCRLIIVDPVNAFVGPSDSHFHTVVRRVLAPLTRLARQKRLAILAVTQFRKNDAAGVYRAAGSTGFVATANALWTVCRDPRDESRSLLLPLKHNLTPHAEGLAFRLLNDLQRQAPRVDWQTDLPALSPREAFRRPPKPRQPAPERLDARTWLQSELAAGPQPANTILEAGERRGFQRRTLQRAFHELAGHTTKKGLHHGWWWSLAPQTPSTLTESSSSTTSTTLVAATSSAESPAQPTEAPRKTAVAFEGVTYETDIRLQSEYDALTVIAPPQWPPIFLPVVPQNTVSTSPTTDNRSDSSPPSLADTRDLFHQLREKLCQPHGANSPPPPPARDQPDSRSKLSTPATPSSDPDAEQVQCERPLRRFVRQPLEPHDQPNSRATADRTHRVASANHHEKSTEKQLHENQAPHEEHLLRSGHRLRRNRRGSPRR